MGSKQRQKAKGSIFLSFVYCYCLLYTARTLCTLPTAHCPQHTADCALD